MINIVPITIDERGNVKKDITILAMENENISKRFSILLPSSLKDKWLYIEFEDAENIKSVSEKLTVVGNYIEYDVTNQLTKKGKLVCQVVAKNGEGVVWKSNKFDFTIPSSINATEEVAANNPDILADLQKQIDDIKVSGGDYKEGDPTVPDHVKNITEADILRWNSGGGGTSTPIVEISGSSVTLEPNKHYVISGVTNSLTISLAEPIESELKHYSFEFSSIDRIPKITINNVDMPFNYEFAKYTKYLCEVVNNNLVILETYDGYPYQFIYGMFASSDFTASYTFKNDRTFTEVISGTTKSGTYQVEVSGEKHMVTITFEDSSIKIFTYDNGTITNNSEVYTKIS